MILLVATNTAKQYAAIPIWSPYSSFTIVAIVKLCEVCPDGNDLQQLPFGRLRPNPLFIVSVKIPFVTIANVENSIFSDNLSFSPLTNDVANIDDHNNQCPQRPPYISPK